MRVSNKTDERTIGVSGFFDRWAAKRTGVSPARLTLRVFLQHVPKRRGLRYGETRSRLGGRIDNHLERLSDEELQTLAAKGEEVLEEFAAAEQKTEDQGEPEQTPVPSVPSDK